MPDLMKDYNPALISKPHMTNIKFYVTKMKLHTLSSAFALYSSHSTDGHVNLFRKHIFDITKMDNYTTPVFDEKLPKADYLKRRAELVMRKRSFINEILKECGTGRPLNVCVVGTYGAGKSSFINTIAAAFNGKRWREHAAIGDYGGTRGVTTYVQRFPKCCQEKKDKYAKVSLPTLVDIAGFPEEESIRHEEILRIFFFGKLGHGDSLNEALESYMVRGIEGLKEKYSQDKKNETVYKIDRIIFVASAGQPIPENLIKCVVNAAQPKGSCQDKYKRAIPIFGVLTHAGEIEVEQDEELEKKVKRFMQNLGIARHRLLLCSNYCDDVDAGIRTGEVLPELDVPVLEFLIQVFDRSLSVLHDDEVYGESPRQIFRRNAVPWNWETDIVKAFALFIIFCVFYLLTIRKS
ncbi:hypothetical protein ACJMK2_026819 [Sinanodonta woodiana]|uniref:Uncharacterized protein n=1 Tax=Sinanodonta woodiana TaxID=1069815 RepID=A0ABD3XL90_SINWO